MGISVSSHQLRLQQQPAATTRRRAARPAAAAYCLISSESEAEAEPLAVVQGKIQIEFQPQSRRSSQATATTAYTRTTEDTEEVGSDEAGDYDLDDLEDVVDSSKVSAESREMSQRNGCDADSERKSADKSEFGSSSSAAGEQLSMGSNTSSSDLSRSGAATASSVAAPPSTAETRKSEGSEVDVPCEQGPAQIADGAKDADRYESLRPQTATDARLAKIPGESVPSCARLDSEQNPAVIAIQEEAVPQAPPIAEVRRVVPPANLDSVLPVAATNAASAAARSDFISVKNEEGQTKAAAAVASGGGKQKKKIKKRPDKAEADDVGRQGKGKVKGKVEKLKDVSSSMAASSASSARSSLKSTGSSAASNEEAIIASQLDRLPSPMRKLLEWKNSPGTERRKASEDPNKEKPKYWNNVPKPCDPTTNPALSMAAMRTEAKEHQKKVKEQQEALLRTSTSEPEEPWYMDEPEDLKEKLLTYQHRPSDHHRNESDKRSPEENMAVIKLYGGVQFPGGPLEDTPRRWLKKLRTVKKRRKLNNNREQDTAVDDGGSSEGQLDCIRRLNSMIWVVP